LDSEIYTDEQVLKNACKDKEFELLWNGHWDQVIDSEGKQKFTQQHFSDFQLVRKLAFYTGNCKTQIERLFRQSPCYQQYGKDGKWTKYESDIRTDIEKATSTCWAVYNPSSYKKDWKPDYHAIYASLTDTDESKRPFRNPKLISILKDYINKYADKNVMVYLAVYNNGRLTDIVKSASGLISTETVNAFYKIPSDLSDTTTNYCLKFFVWNEELVPAGACGAISE